MFWGYLIEHILSLDLFTQFSTGIWVSPTQQITIDTIFYWVPIIMGVLIIFNHRLNRLISLGWQCFTKSLKPELAMWFSHSLGPRDTKKPKIIAVAQNLECLRPKKWANHIIHSGFKLFVKQCHPNKQTNYTSLDHNLEQKSNNIWPPKSNFWPQKVTKNGHLFNHLYQ